MDDGNDLDRLKIVIIRHGEKPKDGDNLTCGGFNRALQLPAVITAKFGVPDMVYIPQLIFGEHTYRMRMLQTIAPLAVKYNLIINTNHLAEDHGPIAAELKTKTGTVLLCWERKAIPFIAKALGVPGDLSWPSYDFDSIWIITFAQGKVVLTRDIESIKPGEDCGFFVFLQVRYEMLDLRLTPLRALPFETLVSNDFNHRDAQSCKTQRSRSVCNTDKYPYFSYSGYPGYPMVVGEDTDNGDGKLKYPHKYPYFSYSGYSN